MPIELRQLAERILLADSLDAKLARFAEIDDDVPGDAVRISAPVRPANLQFAARKTAPLLPHPESLADPAKRGVVHHILANHELQALEVMAWVVLAFPDAPAEFRAGLSRIMDDERRHALLHAARAEKLGVPFGSLPVNGYIWQKSTACETLLEYLASLPLVFEGANLDHTLELENWFREAGDAKGASICRTVHNDEIEHVRFGLEWLRKLKPDSLTDWEAWEANLPWPLRPDKAKGEQFQIAPRRLAGMSDEFIAKLADAGDATT